MTASQMPVTVGLPVYNDPEGLRRSVPSVFEQTWDGELRLLVVDDASTDETPQVLAELQRHYGADRLSILTNERNRGRPYSRNRILDAVTEGHLAWIDADDRWHPDKVALQLETLERNAWRAEPLICTSPLSVEWRERGGSAVLKQPDVRGDQLRNLIVGDLFAYLVTMLGPVEHFRRAGRFDLRLLRRQDYELMLRFLASGGALVSPDTTTPLAVYSKTDVERAATEVARSNRVIWSTYRPLYLRYGRRFAWERRASQHRLVARFCRANGQHLRWLGYSVAAAWLHYLVAPPPGEIVRGPPRLARQKSRALVRRAKKLAVMMLSTLAVLVPFARRTGLARLATATGLSALGSRVGLDRLVERAVFARGPGSAGFRALYGAGRDAAGRPVGAASSVPAAIAIAQDAIRRESYEEAIRCLEALFDEHGPDLGPRVYEALAQAQSKAGDARGAQSTLRQGLEHHPVDERLLLALVQEHTVTREWGDAFSYWQQMPRMPRESLSRWGYVRIARMLRINQRYEEAHAVATEGLGKHPRHPPLQGEHSRIRAHLIDWSQSLTPAPGGAGADAEPDPAGAVEDLGFLRGAMTSPISGFVDADEEAGQEVALQVNGVEVVSTSPLPAEGREGSGRHPFVLSCQDLLEYLGDGDRLTFTLGERPLRIAGVGLACEVRVGHPSRFDHLTAKLDEGFVFTKFGRLRAGHSAERKQATLTLYDDVNTVIAKVTGRPGFPFYGNLLGAVREHDFIEHDVGGFDMAYLSEHTSPEAVKGEFVEICRALFEAGFHLKLEPWCAMTRRDFGDPVFVDVNFAWFSETGDLHISFGWRHEAVRDRNAFLDFRECALHDTIVQVPGNVEDVLVQLYGQGWRVPDQGFTPSAPLQRDERYLLSYAELEDICALAPAQARIVPPSPQDATQ